MSFMNKMNKDYEQQQKKEHENIEKRKRHIYPDPDGTDIGR